MIAIPIPTNRSARLASILGVYAAVLALSFWTAHAVRFDFAIPDDELAAIPTRFFYVVPLQLAFLFLMGQCAGLLSYFSIPELRRLFVGLALPSAGLLFWSGYDHSAHLPSQCVLLDHFIFAFVGLSASRLCFRVIRERYLSPVGKPRRHQRRIGIIGAGDVGASLARDLQRKRGLGMQPVAFFDDNRRKWRSRIHNVPVIGAPQLLGDPSFHLHLDEVVIAMPSAPVRRIKEIVTLLQRGNRRFVTVPSLDQLASGKVSVSQLRQVEIEDLLGRDPITLDKKNIESCLKGRVVMVTGAGGSIGSELCRQIAHFKPSVLLLVDQSEVQLFQIEQELVDHSAHPTVRPLVADIVDEPRLHEIFRLHRPEVVFHAAAHKHVPMLEHQPAEAIKNNTFGTAGLARLAQEYGTERFVMISTDKAINPTSVMGATKRMAELYVQALHGAPGNRTRFMAVRFGNVLGSSGSVVPTFKRQIAAGGPVKVTHPDMTRYFMTIPEAVSLVLQSGAQGCGGEIFVLDMGKPVKIVDLAKQLIELSGLKTGEHIEIEFTGLRPGEKLFEELQHTAENLAPTDHPKILRFVSEPHAITRLNDEFASLQSCLHVLGTDELKLLIKTIVPEYQPFISGASDGRTPETLVRSWRLNASEAPNRLVVPKGGRRDEALTCKL